MVLATGRAIAAARHVPAAAAACPVWAREVTVVAAADLVGAAEGLEAAEADGDRKEADHEYELLKIETQGSAH